MTLYYLGRYIVLLQGFNQIIDKSFYKHISRDYFSNLASIYN